MKRSVRIVSIIVFIIITLFFASTTQLREGQKGIITSFGRPVKVITESGLYFKLPYPIQQVILLDGRNKVLETRHTEMLTRDKKNIILLSYVVWRIDDPLKFYQTVGTPESGDKKLDGLVTNTKIEVVGSYDLSSLVSTNAHDLKVELIEKEILGHVSKQSKDKYGIEVKQVGFKRLSLPEENTAYVLEQMRAERSQQSEKFKVEGEQQAEMIKAEANLEATKIKTESIEKSSIIRGEAEKEAAIIYSSAHSRYPDFYKFLSALESLNTIIDDRTKIILRTDSQPFNYLKQSEED